MVHFDFYSNYPKLDDRMQTKKDALELIQLCSASYESAVKDITKEFIKKSDRLQKERLLFTFRKRIDYLKSKKVISDDLYSSLVVLSEIRNEIHEMDFKKKTIFNHLKDVNTKIVLINQAPNDGRKYQVLVSYCCIQLFHILQKIAPESILHLESIPETEFKEFDDWNS